MGENTGFVREKWFCSWPIMTEFSDWFRQLGNLKYTS